MYGHAVIISLLVDGAHKQLACKQLNPTAAKALPRLVPQHQTCLEHYIVYFIKIQYSRKNNISSEKSSTCAKSSADTSVCCCSVNLKGVHSRANPGVYFGI